MGEYVLIKSYIYMLTKKQCHCLEKKNMLLCESLRVQIFDKFQNMHFAFKKNRACAHFWKRIFKFYANFLTIYVDDEVWCEEEMVGTRCVLTKSYIYAN